MYLDANMTFVKFCMVLDTLLTLASTELSIRVDNVSHLNFAVNINHPTCHYTSGCQMSL